MQQGCRGKLPCELHSRGGIDDIRHTIGDLARFFNNRLSFHDAFIRGCYVLFPERCFQVSQIFRFHYRVARACSSDICSAAVVLRGADIK